MNTRVRAREIAVGGADGTRAGGLALRALCWESPGADGPALLLLHATSFCADVWAPVLEGFTPGGRVALAPDARGHGASEAPSAACGFAWTQLVEDAVAWIDALVEGGAPRVVVAGHSSGATAALAAAARRPERIAGVLAVEPVLFDAPAPGADAFPGSRLLAALARKRRARFASRDEARERLAVRPPFAGFAAESLEAYLAGGFGPGPDGGVRLRCAPEHEAACYEGADALDLWPALAGAPLRLRLVLGERGFVAPAFLEKLRGAVPGTSVETVAGGTHFVALEKPRAVGAALERFVRELTPKNVA